MDNDFIRMYARELALTGYTRYEPGYKMDTIHIRRISGTVYHGEYQATLDTWIVREIVRLCRTMG